MTREGTRGSIVQSCVSVEVDVLGCPDPNKPSGFRGRKSILNHASTLVSIILKVPGEIKRSRDLEEGGGAGPSS